MSTEALRALSLLKSLHQQRCELIPAQLSLLPGQRRHQLPASTPEQHNHRAAKSKHNFCFVSQVVFCFSGFFNLQETFIHVKLYRNNFSFTAPAKSLPVTKSHLCKAVGFIPINLLLQKSVGGWAEPIPAEMRALSGPGCTPENTKSINTEQHFAYFTLQLLLDQRSNDNTSQLRRKGRRGAGAGDCAGGRGSRAAFPNVTSLFRAYAIENADSGGPREFAELCQTG